VRSQFVVRKALKGTNMSQATIPPESGNSTTDRIASMAHEAIDRVTPHANRTEHDVRGAAAKTVEGATFMQVHAVEAAEENLRKVRSVAENNPLITGALVRR
jgi:hypothetical protein